MRIQGGQSQLLCYLVWDSISHIPGWPWTCYVDKNDLELLALLCFHKCWDYRCVTLGPIYALLGCNPGLCIYLTGSVPAQLPQQDGLGKNCWSHAKLYENTDRCSQPRCTASPTPRAAVESAQTPRLSWIPWGVFQKQDKTLGDSGEDWGWASRVVAGKGSQRGEGGHWLETVKVAPSLPAPCCAGTSKQGQPEFTACIRPPTMSSLKQCWCHLPTV